MHRTEERKGTRMKKTCSLIAIGLALCMAVPANATRAMYATAGRSNVFANDTACFVKETAGSVSDTATCGQVYWEIPLVIDNGGTKTISIGVKTKANVGTISCRAASGNIDGTKFQASVPVYSKKSGVAETIIVSIGDLGSVYVSCLTLASTIYSVSYNQ
jgi:hypothetical protein